MIDTDVQISEKIAGLFGRGELPERIHAKYKGTMIVMVWKPDLNAYATLDMSACIMASFVRDGWGINFFEAPAELLELCG